MTLESAEASRSFERVRDVWETLADYKCEVRFTRATVRTSSGVGVEDESSLC